MCRFHTCVPYGKGFILVRCYLFPSRDLMPNLYLFCKAECFSRMATSCFFLLCLEEGVRTLHKTGSFVSHEPLGISACTCGTAWKLEMHQPMMSCVLTRFHDVWYFISSQDLSPNDRLALHLNIRSLRFVFDMTDSRHACAWNTHTAQIRKEWTRRKLLRAALWKSDVQTWKPSYTGSQIIPNCASARYVPRRGTAVNA